MVRVTSRRFTPANWPIKSFTSVSGSEVRLMRGTKPAGAELELSYENITDIEAELFLKHFASRLGTFHTFLLGPKNPSKLAGWTGAPDWMQITASYNVWRWQEPPTVTAAPYPGRSNVTARLISVHS